MKIKGDKKANDLVGTDEDDKIVGFGGNDDITAKGGHDKVDAGGGDDKIVIKANTSVNVDAGKGNDTVKIGAGALGSTVDLGKGADTVDIAASTRSNQTFMIDGGKGDDVVNFAGDQVDFTITDNGEEGFTIVDANGNTYTLTDVSELTFNGAPYTPINPLDSPVVSNPIGDLEIEPDEAFSFTFAANTFTDPNNDPLTYTATLANGDPLPSWLSFDGATRTFSGTPTDANEGSISVRVTASDGSLTASDEFVIEVDDAGGTGGGGGGGGNPIDTKEELEAALAAADDGDTIVIEGNISGRFTIDASVTIRGANGAVINGGFDIEAGAEDVTLRNLDINTVGTGEANAAILADTDIPLNSLTLDGVDVTGTGASGARGLLLNEASGPSGVNVSVNNSSFEGLLTGIYAGVNRGHQFTITDSSFTGNVAGIGGVGNGVGLNITGTTFSGNSDDAIGVEGGARLSSLVLSGNTGALINVYDAFPPHVFQGDNVNEQNVVLVGLGASIASTIAAAGTFTVLLGEGEHTETLLINSQVSLAGVEGAELSGTGGPSIIELLANSDGTVIRGLHFLPANGQNAIYNPNVDAHNISIIDNTFDAGTNTSGTLVYANPGADGWVIDGNTFVGNSLTGSGFIGLEGAGHLVKNNIFGTVAYVNGEVESFTPSVIFEGNQFEDGTPFTNDDVFFSQYGSIAGENGTYVQNVVDISDLTGSTEVRSGSLTILDGPGIARGDSLQFMSADPFDGRLRFNEAFAPSDQIKLGDLDVLQFDYLTDIASSGTATPVLRLAIDADGNMATTNDRGELVFEFVYQNTGNAPRDVWQTIDIVGDDLILWQRSNGVNHDGAPNFQRFSEWSDSDGYTPAGGLNFDADSVVLGYSLAFGSYNGTGVLYADHVAVGTTGAGGEVDLYNFV